MTRTGPTIMRDSSFLYPYNHACFSIQALGLLSPAEHVQRIRATVSVIEKERGCAKAHQRGLQQARISSCSSLSLS